MGACATARPKVVFVTGDDEYRSEITMPMIARILEQECGMDCQVLYAVNPDTGAPDPKDHRHIEGLDALSIADAAVFFLRYRELPDSELARILTFVNSGKAVIGIRTTTHAFQYDSAPNLRWNDEFGLTVFGQKWISHHGHDSQTRVALTESSHPILRGVEPRFTCASWLYSVEPLPADCQILAVGDAEKNGATFGARNPVAWTRLVNGQRVFFTTLGHPADFEQVSVRRLVAQAIVWCLELDDRIPLEGYPAQLPRTYLTPDTH